MPKKLPMGNINRVKRPGGGYYLYHRLTGAKLPGAEGSPEFAIAWANEEIAAREAAKPRHETDPSSYAALWSAFSDPKSDAWNAIGDYSRRDYTKAAEWMMAQGSGARPTTELKQKRCEILLDKAIADLGYRRGIGVLQFNRRLFNWVLERAARKEIWGETNPWATLEPPAAPKRADDAPKRNRPWKPWEVIEVLFAAPIGLRRAYVLGACGCDSATAAGMLWSAYVPELQVTQPLVEGQPPETMAGFEMNRGKTDTESVLFVPAILRMFLDADAERPSAYVATGVPGEAFTVHGLQKRSSEFLAAMAKAGKVGRGLTFHGLRHTIGKAVAESNGTLHAIQGALQHKSPSMALYYSAQADKRRALAAVSDGLDQWFVQNPSPRDCKTLN